MNKNRMIFICVQLIGLFWVGTGTLTILGYIAGDPPLYTWSGSIGMALNTAILFGLGGVALYIIGKNLK